MTASADFLRANLTTEVTSLIDAHVAGPRAVSIRRLLDGYLAGVPESDLNGLDPQVLYGAVMGLFSFLGHRQPGRPSLRIYNPDPEQNGWASTHSVIEIVNDDMPFLVASVAAELTRLGISIHLLVHPILAVGRDGEGQLTEISDRPLDGATSESVMHMHVDRHDQATHETIAARLRAVLADVRAAVEDWAAMREALRAGTAELTAGHSATEDISETAQFLSWLHGDNFTFLGYRSFTLIPEVAAEPGGLGLLRDPDRRVFDGTLPLGSMPADIRAFLRQPGVLLVTKSACLSSVHRPVNMDVVGVKRFSGDGQVVGLHTFLGLFTSAAYTKSPLQIPLLRRKVAAALDRANFPPMAHDAKALANILETFPRDELFQASEDRLFSTAMGILRLLGRPRPALFVRPDEFERFVSCIVFLPRDRYDTPLRMAVQALLESAFCGKLAAYHIQVSDLPLARLYIVIRTTPGALPAIDERDLEGRLGEITRSWADHLQSALVQAHGEVEGLRLARRYGTAFPASYQERYPVPSALPDVERIEKILAGADIALTLSRPVEAAENQAWLKLHRRAYTVALSDVLPMLEAMGLKVIAEVPHRVSPADGGPPVWIHDFEMESADGSAIDLGHRRQLFEEALIKVWQGDAEIDGFNRLVLRAGLSWREVAIIRAYAKYLRQAGSTLSQTYVERALSDNPDAAGALVRLFLARFDPAGASGDPAAEVEAALAAITSADDDRILRRFLNLIRATLRTNYFQPGPKPYLALKLDSRAIEDLPQPRPMVEIWIYSPRVEAVHLRGGKVARGGIRWSDRREDFRTEVLGLMKAQMVKNAVIVPVGAKGGFVVKRPPKTREALLAEGIACYQIMMRGLLDLTDNLQGSVVVPPPGVVCLDGDDPYLVVAADKGTASFSDIANAVSLDYGFWLGDAFASGGSRGYDHKAMGITARGAWEAVKRHFRELGADSQTQPVTAIGVGDMSGDVFGNAMLQSPTLRLIGAFNHSHIFVDPNPDAERSFAERERLFRSGKAWPDYDPGLISPGGGVFPRSAKTIPVGPELKVLFGIGVDSIRPNDLIRAMLTAPTDLLFFGGIGTYVKAHGEKDPEVGDRANDALRVNGRDLKARVIGEGANLAMTQLGRIEFALGGGRLNTDAIDNSAGVDTSDHEVNIKILLDSLVTGGDLTGKQRDSLLAAMTDEVAQLVLRDNYLQTQAISVMEAQGADLLDPQARFMRLLEKAGRLDRALEFLPDDETLTRRAAAKIGLTRPELAVLLAYAKIWLFDAIVHSDLPDDPFLAQDLALAFPSAIRERFAGDIPKHRLRREIVATSITNSMINRVGVAFVADLMEGTGYAPADIARAYLVARDAYGLPGVWREIEGLDGEVPASAQTALLVESNRLLERATAWVLRCVATPFDIGAAIAELTHGIAQLDTTLPRLLPDDLAQTLTGRADEFKARGIPEPLAQRVSRLIVLASAADVVRIAAKHRLTVESAGGLYFAVGTRFDLGSLRVSATNLAVRGHWEKLAAGAAIEELYSHQRDITTAVAGAALDLSAADAIATWAATRRASIERIDALLAEIKAGTQIDLARLVVINRHLRALTDNALRS